MGSYAFNRDPFGIYIQDGIEAGKTQRSLKVFTIAQAGDNKGLNYVVMEGLMQEIQIT